MDAEKKSRCILKNTDRPSLRTFNDIAIPIGIIESNTNQDVSDWLALNFSNLYYRFSWNQIVFDVKPFYKWDCFISNIIKTKINNEKDFVSVIKNHILKGEYIYLFADEYYIPNRNSYGRSSHSHDLCTYGFDDYKRMFYISAYDNNGQYVLQEIEYEKLYIAYKHSKKQKNKLILIRCKKNYKFNTINTNDIKKALKEYVSSMKFWKGIKIYFFIKCRLKLFPKHKIDMHYFRILMEHIQVIHNCSLLNLDYYNNYINSKKIFYMALKYTVNKDESLFLRIITEINALKQNEKENIERFLNE